MYIFQEAHWTIHTSSQSRIRHLDIICLVGVQVIKCQCDSKQKVSLDGFVGEKTETKNKKRSKEEGREKNNNNKNNNNNTKK